MSEWTEQDVKEMEKTWLEQNDVQGLQKQGIAMTMLFWRERQQRRYLEKLVQHLRKDNQESQNTVAHMEYHKNRTQDSLNVTWKNFTSLADTILKLSQKENGKPLNHEMSQIVNLVLNAHIQQDTDMIQLKQKYSTIMANMEKQSKKKTRNNK